MKYVCIKVYTEMVLKNSTFLFVYNNYINTQQFCKEIQTKKNVSHYLQLYKLLHFKKQTNVIYKILIVVYRCKFYKCTIN